MAHDLIIGGSGLGILGQQLGNEVLRGSRDSLPCVRTEIDLVVHNLVKNVALVVSIKWRLTRQEDVGDHADAPHVAHLVIGRTTDDLRSHVARCTTAGSS